MDGSSAACACASRGLRQQRRVCFFGRDRQARSLSLASYMTDDHANQPHLFRREVVGLGDVAGPAARRDVAGRVALARHELIEPAPGLADLAAAVGAGTREQLRVLLYRQVERSALLPGPVAGELPALAGRSCPGPDPVGVALSVSSVLRSAVVHVPESVPYRTPVRQARERPDRPRLAARAVLAVTARARAIPLGKWPGARPPGRAGAWTGRGLGACRPRGAGSILGRWPGSALSLPDDPARAARRAVAGTMAAGSPAWSGALPDASRRPLDLRATHARRLHAQGSKRLGPRARLRTRATRVR